MSKISKPMRQFLLLALVITSVFSACKKGNKNGNQAPETQISIKEINLVGNNRLQTVIRLNWFGIDPDGYIKGYEISLDNSNWNFVTTQDSTFRFSISSGSDTTDIDFYVRAIDDLDTRDPSPAYLKIPLKNMPPTAEIDDEYFAGDTTHSVLTFRWNANDLDGAETIKEAYIKVNEGNWFSIPVNKKLVSLVSTTPEATGNVTANVYMQSETSPLATTIDGLVLNGNNKIYIRVKDIAGSESLIDTSEVVYMKNKKGDLLFINGQPNGVRDNYLNIFNSVYTNNYDFIDYYEQSGKNQPKFWNPNFTLLIKLYKKLFINSDPTLFTNSITGVNSILLEFATPSLQEFIDEGGRVLVTANFPTDRSLFDLETLRGVLPIDSLVTVPSNQQARIVSDSAIVPQVAGNYPSVKPNSVITGVVPFYPTPDSEIFYKAQLTKINGWSGTNTVAARRVQAGKVVQVFFSVELYRFDKVQSDLNALFNKILNEDFN